ncbi:immunoglobulin-binding protein 1b-like [Corticium candelabrum]|uniref:immunoglobulin-binding protein 1b-like n=1 Tax=Corticium candelabrum TaxID=121492 RepID=UPI002E253E85|nr:immunoglobulin-binding protein 1b-like [Corticium candelabrum]
MAAAVDSDWSLREVFKRAWGLYGEIESFHGSSMDDAHQSRIRDAIKQFEQATRLVNDFALFSDNEELTEVTTPSVKYLLLPALLGQLHMKLTDSMRRERLETAKIYFRDFLQRCEQYGLEMKDKSVLKDAAVESNGRTESPDVASMASRRQAKIEEYRRIKADTERLTQLEEMLEKNPEDEETEREYYIMQLNVNIQKAIDELRSIAQEINILKQIEKASQTDSQPPSKPKQCDPSDRQPRGPFLLLPRNEAQKKVFGAGYPSLPTMTLDEFYEQRYKDHMQKVTQTTETAKRSQEEDKDRDEDNDEKLKGMREWDDFKDTHRRGWGNRQNMG